MEESIYATLSDRYFAVLLDTETWKSPAAYQQKVDSYLRFLTRLELQHSARLQDIDDIGHTVEEINAQVNAAQAEIDAQSDELKQVDYTNMQYARIKKLLNQKFAEPVELLAHRGDDDDNEGDDQDNNDYGDKEVDPIRVKVVLNETVDQLVLKQKSLTQAVEDLDNESNLDMADFYDRLDDLNAISRILESFQRKYQQPRQSSLAEENGTGGDSGHDGGHGDERDDSQDDGSQNSQDEDMEDVNRRDSDSDLMGKE